MKNGKPREGIDRRDPYGVTVPDMHRAIGTGAKAKRNAYLKPSLRGAFADDPTDPSIPVFDPDRHFNEANKDFDVSDTPQEPQGPRKKGPPPIPDRRPAARGRLPGVSGQPGPRMGFGRKDESEQDWNKPSEWDVTDRRSGTIYRLTARTPGEAKSLLLKHRPELRDLDPFDLSADPTGRKTAERGKKAPEGQAGWGAGRYDAPANKRNGTEELGADDTMQRIGGKWADRSNEPGGESSAEKLANAYADTDAAGTSFDNVSTASGQVTGQQSPFAKGSQPNTQARTALHRPQASGKRTTPFRKQESAGAAGFQMPLGSDDPQNEGLKKLREAIRSIIQEVVRKKKSGGGYVLYSPNRRKKKDPKPVGEFPTRLRAKEAELNRFPPKDTEQLKRARKRLEKLKKDPKKAAEKERAELSSKPKGVHRKSGAKKSKGKAKESTDIQALAGQMSRQLSEALFREDEVPGSPWDERLASLQPDHLASDKKLHSLHKGVEKGSLSALGDAHRGLAKALKKMGRLTPGEASFDPERRKHFIPCMLDCDGTEVGPIHLYVDGGHIKIEVSDAARKAIVGMDPEQAAGLRGILTSYQEDELPRIDHAIKAVGARDAYLDKLHGKLDGMLSGMSPVEMHIIRHLMRNRRR